MGKPGGWEAYEKLTDEKADKIEKIIEDSDINIENVMKEIDKIDTKTKFQAFGKTKLTSRKALNNKLDNKTQDEKDAAIKQKETEKVENQIEKIKSKNQGRAGNVFRIRKDIVGPKKAGQEATSVKDPSTGEILVTKDDIKKATLNYCVKNLKGNKPDKSVVEMIKQRKANQLKKMDEDDEETFEVDIEDFKDVLKKFTTKNTKTYDFLLKSGNKYKMAKYKLCKRIIDTKDIPQAFLRTTLYMIWKMKGPMNILKNNRFLHMKQVMARTIDALVVGQMKEPLVT